MAKSIEASLDEVLSGSGVTIGGSVNILNTGKLQNLLGDWCSDDTGTTGSGGQLDSDGSTLAGCLLGDGVDFADLVTPVATSNRHNGQLGQNDGATNGGRYFFGALHAQTNVTIVITDGNDGLEACTLTGLRLLLYGLDFKHFIL